MLYDPQRLSAFKADLHRARDSNREAWESSIRLVGHGNLAVTLSRLVRSIETSDQPAPLKDLLINCLAGGVTGAPKQVDGERLKALTGLPPSKAMRALCVLFGVAGSNMKPAPCSSWSPSDIEAYVRAHPNPYDLLLDADVASLLDLGAGDLSFAAELADQYVPRFQERQRTLVLHAVDRLQPGSQLGGRLHADPTVLKTLRAWRHHPLSPLNFRFWGNQDMLALNKNTDVWPSYTMVTCHAPATPTFAYEPTRLPAELIAADLQRSKGAYRTVRMQGEDALEVQHAGRALLFPPWKFEVRGPLALLALMAQRGKCCVMMSVDTQVFWETLAQLLEDPRVRPAGVLYTPLTLPDGFGPRYTELSALPIGRSVVLSDLGELRSSLPGAEDQAGSGYRFRYVEIRRGAVFHGIPAGQTARLFNTMSEEAPPWCLILVPEPLSV